jgi:hypothetical protein
VVQKPFGVVPLMEMLTPLLERVAERRLQSEFGTDAPPVPVTPISDEERVRAAVTVALDEAMPAMIELLTREVLRNLRQS